MKQNKEITVKINSTYNKLHKYLVKHGLNIEFLVQIVNNKYVFIEMEDKEYHGGKKYDNIDYDRSDYFVKKAQIILNENR